MSIRLATPDSLADYATIAELHSLAIIDPASAEELYSTEVQMPHDTYPRRKVARGFDDSILGTSLIRPRGEQTYITVSTYPEHRCQGIGSALYSDALAFVRQQPLAPLVTMLCDNVPEARSFAEHRGFGLHQHWKYFGLDLTTFDKSCFDETLAAVKERGIRFFTLADVGNTLPNQRKLYDLNRSTSLEAPGETSFPSFEEFVQDICHASWFQPDCQILAADGDQWVGLGAVGLEPYNPQIAFVAFTGVDRAYRRQQIATALTLQLIEYAQQHGATELQVFNDSRNVGMFAMQDKLGYHPIPGRYIMMRPIDV